MKKCSLCKIEKPLEEFNKKLNKLQCYCIECNKQNLRKYYVENKENRVRKIMDNRKSIRDYIKSQKDVPCKDCWVKYPYYVMDFDHLYDKKFNLGSAHLLRWRFQIEKEIAKCDVVCANCHRIRTHSRLV